jgi:hypothetical protein
MNLRSTQYQNAKNNFKSDYENQGNKNIFEHSNFYEKKNATNLRSTQ